MEFLVLEVDHARFGIPTADVHEVVRAVSLGDAPAQFPNMIGMLNFRGQVLGVLDSAFLQGRSNRELAPHEHLIILQGERQLFALRVDQAIEIMTWTDGQERTDTPVPDSAENRWHAIGHPRFGIVFLLETATLWSELHHKQSEQPTQEVEAR